MAERPSHRDREQAGTEPPLLRVPTDCDGEVVLHRDEVLGNGAYGRVCIAEYRGARCAAKIMHDIIFDPIALLEMPPARRHRNPYARFVQECQVLSRLERHPNVIHYLCTYEDPNNGGRPVLLMELMETSLSHYISRQGGAVPYRVQVDISNDIVQALTFLHHHRIIHRDLSANNVLLNGTTGMPPLRVTAKVTDFGVVARVEASSESTLEHRFNSLTVCPGSNVYMPPEAVQENPVYTEKIDCFSFGVIVVQILTQQFPHPADRHQRVSRTLDRRVPEVERRRNHISLIDEGHPLLPVALECLKDDQRDRPSAQQLCERLEVIKGAPLYTESRQDASWSDVQAQRQQGRDRQRAIQVPERRGIQASHRRMEPAEEERDEPDMRLSWRRGSAAPCKIYRWCDAVVSGTVVYFRQAGKGNLHINYSYNMNSRRWNLLPRCPLGHPTLAILNGQLTVIGDKTPLSNCLFTLQEEGRGNDEERWISIYPPMPTRRYLTTALSTETSLIVAGGVGEGNRLLNTVEVMDKATQVWYTAADLPLLLTRCSVTLCGNRVYVLGGLTINESSPAVLTCSLTRLLESCHATAAARSPRSGQDLDVIWDRVADLPVCDSTCVFLRGHLVAIGGRDSDTDSATSSIYLYKPATNSWEVISHMTTPRFKCFAAVLPDTQVMIVGGAVRNVPRFMCSQEVEFATVQM